MIAKGNPIFSEPIISKPQNNFEILFGNFLMLKFKFIYESVSN
jgi:hypothetical protein